MNSDRIIDDDDLILTHIEDCRAELKTCEKAYRKVLAGDYGEPPFENHWREFKACVSRLCGYAEILLRAQMKSD